MRGTQVAIGNFSRKFKRRVEIEKEKKTYCIFHTAITNVNMKNSEVTLMKAKVYFTDMHATMGENLLQKLACLIKTAGIDRIDFEKKFTAIKVHFGEPGNLAYLRPNYAKTIVEMVKERGGKPFLRTVIRYTWVGGKMPWIIWIRPT